MMTFTKVNTTYWKPQSGQRGAELCEKRRLLWLGRVKRGLAVC
jgi:hypothetical protein